MQRGRSITLLRSNISTVDSQFLIYGLVDPRNSQLRYIGQSSTSLDRPSRHWRTKRFREANDHCHCWVRNVLSSGQKPSIVVIQVFDDFEILNDAEIFWIAYFRKAGHRLTNMTDGGGGTRGVPSAWKGKELSPEHRAKIGKASKGRIPWNRGLKTAVTHADSYARSGEKQKRRAGTFSKETLEKISVASSGRIPWNKGKHPPGKPHTKETIEKMRLSALRRWGHL